MILLKADWRIQAFGLAYRPLLSAAGHLPIWHCLTPAIHRHECTPTSAKHWLVSTIYSIYKHSKHPNRGLNTLPHPNIGQNTLPASQHWSEYTTSIPTLVRIHCQHPNIGQNTLLASQHWSKYTPSIPTLVRIHYQHPTSVKIHSQHPSRGQIHSQHPNRGLNKLLASKHRS